MLRETECKMWDQLLRARALLLLHGRRDPQPAEGSLGKGGQ